MAEFTFEPLTPTAFLRRSAVVFAGRTAVVDGDRVFTYGELAERSRALTGLLDSLGVGEGDRVAALCANSHVMLELHEGVPLRGAVLVPLNTRLAVDELCYIIRHCGAAVIVATAEFAEAARRIVDAAGVRAVIAGGPDDEYERRLAVATPAPIPIADETTLLAVNYTSGTTGPPKGVMYHHRGAYLQALAMALHNGLDPASRYLWTLPMFHCHGWSFPWAVTAAGATHVCLRSIDPDAIWGLLRRHRITHFSAAPTVLSMIANAPEAAGPALESAVAVTTGGAPPSPTLLARMRELNMDVTHLYGLTETFGPIAVNQWNPDWDAASPDQQAVLRARQGVPNVIASPLRVVDEHGADVTADATTLGEVAVRGNDVMLGYYRDDTATREATVDGWLRTGDLAVRHPDGYLEIRDRRKDIIISGGENISSVEVERVLDSHPAVLESAVVGVAHDRWGEVPVAFVDLKPDRAADEEDLIRHVRGRIAAFKAPKRVVFGPLPKTSTGKTRKNLLRQRLVADVLPDAGH
ncbi:AMP-binding protein [Jiangella asiatica]|uniref:Acyl-CoA synthetase n=1 Tax=Jiangella asiatica TaxID=2530372 RepID=A0A4R5DGW2_9ACTN|nr:AMP-binding protein [Jiangella asiatica]TDE11160.1 acyl-CoA synthetase [Jiangella asiatica]